MSKLFIPNSVALRNFDSIFVNNDFDFTDNNAEIRFHDTYVAMHPVGIALYAALGDRFRAEGIKTKAFCNKKISSLPYLQRMGLFNALGYVNPIETKEHEETGRFIPLMKIRNGVELESFIKTIDPILHTTRDNSRVIKHVFSELLRNVIEHSNAKFGGNVCATYNKKKKKITIGISDAGMGIMTSMRRSHDVKTHKEAILKAITPGITGSTSRIGGNAENAGAGLFFTKCIAQSTRNHLLIYSGDAYFKLKLTPKGKPLTFNPDPLNDYCTIKEHLPFFKGTLIGIDIHIEDNSTFNGLIKDIGDAYMAGVKKVKRDYSSRIKFI